METQAQPPQQSQYQSPANRALPGQQMMKITIQPSQLSDNDRSSSELRALDCNLTSLCDHIQIEGFNTGAFSDVVVLAMGSTYHLHRLILSRSPYFRNMLYGPWKEATAPTVNLHIDDNNVNGEAIATALAYLYGHHPKLNDTNAFRVLAAASFLDLQDLCAICTDFIISELWTSNFLSYQIFAESQDYGIHGERVRNACWGYLCQSGSMELKEVLPKLSSQTLHALLTSDELWVASEEKRYELALYTFLAKFAQCKQESSEHGSDSETGIDTHSDSSCSKGKNLVEAFADKRLESELGSMAAKGGMEGANCDIFADLGGITVTQSGASSSRKQAHHISNPPSKLNNGYPCNTVVSSSGNSFSNTHTVQTSRSYSEIPVGLMASGLVNPGVALEGPSDEGSCFHLNDNNDWLARDDFSRSCSSMNSSSNELVASDWPRCGLPSISWGGRTVGDRQLKVHTKTNSAVHGEEYDGFVNIFEGGSVLYCNMFFEALLTVRKQLEELGFPCKAVNDGLWLQMLLSQRVQEIGADTCKSCCFVSMSCVCRQPFGFSNHGASSASGYYLQEHDQNNAPNNNMGNVYVAESAPNDGNGPFRPARLHVRVPVEGLAGIGRGNSFVPAAAWPPTRFVFSRVPFGMGNRNCQQPPTNDESETRIDHDGLNALVGLSQSGSGSGEQTERGYEMDLRNRMSGTSISDAAQCSSGVSVPVIQSSQNNGVGVEWDGTNSSSISLDTRTPLSHFPPFRFGVQFEDVHRLSDGQVKHSPEVFYAGSFWKVSVQAFNDEDPQGRRTLGLFLHRRKAEITDSLRKVHLYVDTREKVTARYQLICPSKREVMVFGSFKQAGTLLPKAPKGWGWRTALLFDELHDLLQNGALRVAALIQLV